MTAQVGAPAALALDAGLRIGGVLLAAAVVLFVLRGRGDAPVLWARLRTWAVIAAVWLGAVAGGPAGTRGLAVGLALVGAVECGRLVGLRGVDRTWLVVASAAVPAATAWGSVGVAVALALGVLGVTVAPLAAQDVEEGWARIGRGVTGLLWVGGGTAAVAALPGTALVALGAAVALADVGAFTAGAVAGRRLLAPGLSPAKTVEGVLGGAVGATLGLALVADLAGVALVLVPLLGVAVAVAATWGDLLESLAKRTAGVKDAGGWLPGFGGLLDRVDSLLVVAPAWWAVGAVVRAAARGISG